MPSEPTEAVPTLSLDSTAFMDIIERARKQALITVGDLMAEQVDGLDDEIAATLLGTFAVATAYMARNIVVAVNDRLKAQYDLPA